MVHTGPTGHTYQGESTDPSRPQCQHSVSAATASFLLATHHLHHSLQHWDFNLAPAPGFEDATSSSPEPAQMLVSTRRSLQYLLPPEFTPTPTPDTTPEAEPVYTTWCTERVIVLAMYVVVGNSKLTNAGLVLGVNRTSAGFPKNLCDSEKSVTSKSVVSCMRNRVDEDRFIAATEVATALVKDRSLSQLGKKGPTVAAIQHSSAAPVVASTGPSQTSNVSSFPNSVQPTCRAKVPAVRGDIAWIACLKGKSKSRLLDASSDFWTEIGKNVQPTMQAYLQETEYMALDVLSMALHMQIGHTRFRQVIPVSASAPGGRLALINADLLR
ncbi:TPA: hypothetical protein ACH3X1_008598 [Trebouxia sp. C0004]